MVTHQIKLMHVILLRRMNGNFGGRQSKDEPSAANIDVWQIEHIAQESSVGFRIRTVDDRMRPSNQELLLVLLALTLPRLKAIIHARGWFLYARLAFAGRPC